MHRVNYFSRLVVLRLYYVLKWYKFLNIPQSVRDGLTYSSHKPYGKSLREGYMQKHQDLLEEVVVKNG